MNYSNLTSIWSPLTRLTRVVHNEMAESEQCQIIWPRPLDKTHLEFAVACYDRIKAMPAKIIAEKQGDSNDEVVLIIEELPKKNNGKKVFATPLKPEDRFAATVSQAKEQPDTFHDVLAASHRFTESMSVKATVEKQGEEEVTLATESLPKNAAFPAVKAPELPPVFSPATRRIQFNNIRGSLTKKLENGWTGAADMPFFAVRLEVHTLVFTEGFEVVLEGDWEGDTATWIIAPIPDAMGG